MRGKILIGMLAGVAVAFVTPALVLEDGISAAAQTAKKKKKPKKCKDGEPLDLAKVNFVEGPNLPAMIKQPLNGKRGNAGDALKWMAHRRLGNCLACHVISKVMEMSKSKARIVVAVKKNGNQVKMPLGFHGKIGPPLDGVGERYTEGEIRGLIVDPKRSFPDTIMPSFHRNTGFTRVAKDCVGRAMLKASQVEDIVAYLKALK